MAVIKKLAPDVASKIAAGEVVEKPYNVVKELMENSCDAEAAKIIIEIEDGGLSKIKITDNGKGIAPEDLPLALERFATSKAESVDDVYSASTFGFRGEALAAVSSVSDFSLRSGRDGKAYEIKSKYGVVGDVRPAPAIQGTTIDVVKLFENLPARRKFLKSSKSLEGEIIKLVKHFSLVNPNIEVTLICDGKEVFHVNQSDDLCMRAAKVFAGKAFCLGHAEYKGIKIDAAATIPSASDRLKRDAIILGVNGRLIKDQSLIQAVISAYYRLIPDGRFPAAVVNIYIEPNLVDANVHPAKLEVRFENPRDIFSLVSEAVGNSFKGRGVNLDYNDIPAPVKVYSIEENVKEKEESFAPIHSVSTNYSKPVSTSSFVESVTKDECNINKIENIKPIQTETKPEYAFNIDKELNQDEYQVVEKLQNENVTFEEKVAYGRFRVVGQIDNTYIIIETEDKHILFIDQHAAHERILFEKIQAENNQKPKPSIVLHEPVIVNLTDEIVECIDDYKLQIAKFGYDYKIIDKDKIEVERVPYTVVRKDIEKELSIILADLCVTGKSKQEDAPRALLSCKSAIKAGDELTYNEMDYLVKLLFSTNNFGTCPHGRPIVYAMTLNELARKFYR